MVDERDQDLDQMLDSLRGDQPSEKELRRWHAAVDAAAKAKPRSYLWPLLAAGLVGAIIGGTGALTLPRGDEPCIKSYNQTLAVENFEADATFELTYVKLD